MDSTTTSFELTARLFKAKANRFAVIGTGIALFTVVLASLLACAVRFDAISIDGIIAVQASNPALWLLDLTPFVFAFWGQYTGSMMAYEASAFVMDETADLRKKASALEYQIEHGQTEGPRLGLPNRRALRSALSQMLARPPDAAKCPAVLMFEIDQLRDVDRMMGEEIAEDLMRIVAQRLQNIISREQILAYLGHSDFALLSVGSIDQSELSKQADRIHRALDTPVSIAGMQISLQARVGATIANEAGMIDAESLLRRAEIAKYAARIEHKYFQLYDASLETRRAGKLSLTAELHSSLGHEGLELSFAPQIRLDDESSSQSGRRMRLYPRWPHPHRGLLEESEFVDLPERGGLLHSLCLWLLQQGLDQLEQWRREHDPKLVMVLRLPEQAMIRLPLGEMLTRLLAAHDLPGDALVLEFSEASLRGSDRSSVRQMEALSRQGVGICLSGMGGAYCSLTTLLDYPIGEVALDTELTQRAQHEDKARLLLESYLTLARKLKLDSSASGIQSRSQLELLREMGCDWASGSAVQPMRNTHDSAEWLKRQIGEISPL